MPTHTGRHHRSAPAHFSRSTAKSNAPYYWWPVPTGGNVKNVTTGRGPVPTGGATGVTTGRHRWEPVISSMVHLISQLNVKNVPVPTGGATGVGRHTGENRSPVVWCIWFGSWTWKMPLPVSRPVPTGRDRWCDRSGPVVRPVTTGRDHYLGLIDRSENLESECIQLPKFVYYYASIKLIYILHDL